MGTWGTRPNQGDGAHNLFSKVEDAAKAVLDSFFSFQECSSHDKWNRIGALQLYLEAGFCVDTGTLYKARKMLKEIVKDEKFVYGWVNTDRFFKSHELTLKTIEQLIEKDIIQEIEKNNSLDMSKDLSIKLRKNKDLKTDLGRNTLWTQEWIDRFNNLCPALKIQSCVDK
jgi:hypothetical protein